jgi:hypothetical protein
MGATRLGLAFGLVLGLACGRIIAQAPASVPTPVPRDSSQVSPPKPLPATGLIRPDSAQNTIQGLRRDTLSARPKSRSDSVIVVKHEFNHKEQIITGSVIMTCLALMLVAMNNYNPR